MVSHSAAVATLQNFRTLGCSRSLACRTNPLGRQALELHRMGRAGPPSRGLDCGVPGYLHQNPGYCALSQLLSAQKKFSGRPWIDLRSLPIFPTIPILQGSLTTFAVLKPITVLSPTAKKGALCSPESLEVPHRNIATLPPFSWPTIVHCTPPPQDSPRRRVILVSHRTTASRASLELSCC